MGILQSALLGLLQGLCEFLPVSSSGHLLLARLLMGLQTDDPALKMLDIFLHVGTLIPVAVVFRKEWAAMLAHPFKNRTLVLLFVASLPTLIIYLMAKKLFPSVHGFAVFDSGWFLGGAFLLTALFLLICDLHAGKSSGKRKTGLLTALVMGVFQGVGMIPGVSRSGSTITGGVLAGIGKQEAARFSFMMSAPAILGSLLMEGKDALEAGYLQHLSFLPTVVGILIACAAGFAAIRFMLRIISRIPMSCFALYLAVLGIVYLSLQLSGNTMVPPFHPESVPVF